MGIAIVDLPKVIDLAIGTPEPGAVNFPILNSLLHIIVKNLNLESYRVEFRGSHGCSVQTLLNSSPIDTPTILQEFTVKMEKDDNDGKITETREAKKKELKESYSTIAVVCKSNECDPNDISVSTCMSPDGFQLQPINIVSQEDFQQLSQKVDHLHNAFNGALPNTGHGLHETVHKNTLDTHNPTKRMDALEMGLQKLSSYINHLAGEFKKCEKVASKYGMYANATSEMRDRIDDIYKIMYDEGKVESPTAGIHAPSVQVSETVLINNTPSGLLKQGGGPQSNFGLPVGYSDDELQFIRLEIAKLHNGFQQMGEALEASQMIPAEVLQNFQSATEVLPYRSSTSSKTIGKDDTDEKESKKPKRPDRKVQALEGKVASLERQTDEFDKTLSCMGEQITLISNQVLESQDNPEKLEMITKIKKLLSDIGNLKENVSNLNIERDRLDELTIQLSERCEELELLKMDKEEVEELLAEKADYKILQKKVSVDQFDATKRDLENSIQKVLSEIIRTDSKFQTALKELEISVETKTSKDEIEIMKKKFNDILRLIQENLKALNAIKGDPEAAGTKSKYLKNVNCISCDQKAIMKVDENTCGIPIQSRLAPSKSLKPFLAFELDQIRKELRETGTSRNLHHFEALSKEKRNAGFFGVKDKHLCSRYCGGSHTTIAQKMKLAKTNLVRDKGNVNANETDFLVRGSDGTMYRGVPPAVAAGNQMEAKCETVIPITVS